ncbi:MAG: hypothetical protein H6617_05310 [Bdellovibrionaceae bacterium]|nr:hypothetical protein [Bdellovibrionales bacterium]MCB9254083.1 hypothetical protein [Pseudobdellovibrionaceae bacterium]
MARLLAVTFLILLLQLIPSSAFADDTQSKAEEVVALRDEMLKTRDNRVLYLSQFKSRFGKDIASATIHRGMDVAPAQHAHIAWIVINFKDGSSVMVVANMGMQTVDQVIKLTESEKKEIEGYTPVPQGNQIQPQKKKATAHAVKDPSRLLDVMAQYRINMKSVSALDNGKLTVGNLEYVPNTNHPAPTVQPTQNPTHQNDFRDRIRQQGQRPPAPQPRTNRN